MNRIEEISEELDRFESWRKKNHKYTEMEAHARYVLYLQALPIKNTLLYKG
jgi:hypothetical protein